LYIRNPISYIHRLLLLQGKYDGIGQSANDAKGTSTQEPTTAISIFSSMSRTGAVHIAVVELGSRAF
jgi:hypothetical protein